jgi:Polyketide cyclase / dehydrase and lipid transport
MKLNAITLSLPFACVAMMAGPALALDAKVAKDSAAAPEAVWAVIGDFCNIQTWHPAVEKCEISNKDGATFRTLTLKGGGTLYEKQTAFDKAKMSYSYTIEEGVLPVAKYTSTLRVVPKDQGSTIEWSGNFDAKGASDADAVKTMTGAYDAGVSALVAKAK